MGRPAIYREGQIFKEIIQGIPWQSPPMPSLEKIRGYEIPKEDQVWFRREEYLQWEWNVEEKDERGNKLKLWHEDASPEQLQWYEDEIERLHVGDWIMINGVPTYFNKYAYFFHQWFVLLEGFYPIFKDTSLEYFRFYELCERDRFTLGDCGIKGRRVGLSSMSACIKLLIAILENNTLQGIVSKTGTDAQEMYFMVKNGLENLPTFIMPDLNKVNDSEIHVAKPAKRISKNNTKASNDKGKNNRINWLDTAENAYDGRGVRHVTIDEAGKWERVNVQICITKITDTLVKGSAVKGHMSVFSTVNKGDKGGENFKTIWMGSDHVNGLKDRFGRTETKLKRFFFPGYRGLFGYIGKYGESVVDTPTRAQTAYLSKVIDPETGDLACADPTIGAKEYLQEERKMKENDPDLYAEQVRKYPFEWEEVFKGTNSSCHFDEDAINEQLGKLDLELNGRKENGRRMSFVKEDKNSDPYPIDDPKGMFYVLELPKTPNLKTTIGSIKCPDNTAYGAAGLDSFANAKATVEKGSDACLIIHKRYDALNPEMSGMPVLMFIGRPKTKPEFHNQVYWALEYYGIKMLAERSPTDWEDYAVNPQNKLASPIDYIKKHGYLVTTKRSNGTEVYGIAPQDKEAIEQHLTEMVEYAQNNMHKIKFVRLLKDMLKFNVKDRTVFDACMAWGYALMALRESHTKAVQVKKVQKILQIKHSRKYY